MIEAIPPARVQSVWEQAQPILQRACEHSGERTTHDVLMALLSGHAQLWRVHDDAWCVTEIVNYPRKKVANVSIVGGRNAKRWCRELADTCIDWAKRYQADEIRIVGRRGWLRWLPEAQETTVMTCQLRSSAPRAP